MKSFWDARTPGEQRTLYIGGFVLGLSLLYGVVLDPLYQYTRGLRTQVTSQRSLLTWLQQAESALSGQPKSQPNLPPELTPYVISQHELEWQFKEVPFDLLLNWLARTSPINVLQANLGQTPGSANVTLKFSQPRVDNSR